MNLSMSYSTARSQYQTEVSIPPSLPQEDSLIKKHFFGRMKQEMAFIQDGEDVFYFENEHESE